MGELIVVARLDEVPPGSRRFVMIDGQPAALFNIGGELFCIADVCTHDGGSLADGELYGHEIECPRHGALFDVRTGAVLTFPATAPTRVYAVTVEGDQVLVARPE